MSNNLQEDYGDWHSVEEIFPDEMREVFQMEPNSLPEWYDPDLGGEG